MAKKKTEETYDVIIRGVYHEIKAENIVELKKILEERFGMVTLPQGKGVRR